MGGTVCKHERSYADGEPVLLDANLLWKYYLVPHVCEDCRTDGRRTTFVKQRKVGIVTGVIYSEKFYDIKKCPHREFTVDESTRRAFSVGDDSLSNAVVGMMTAGWLQASNKMYYGAEANCNCCRRRFAVKCDRVTKRVWRNGEQVTEETCAAWQIRLKAVQSTRTETTHTIDYRS